jgi:hypothetical protein
MERIELDVKCPDCGGTGLYVGMGEKIGAAIVCYKCNGTGKYHFVYQYEKFIKREDKTGIKRVYKCNPGICIGENDKIRLEDFGGVDYTQWIKNGKFPEKSEDRKYTCPAWWYQTSDYKKKPDWNECLPCGSFSNCDHFIDKAQCWDRFDKEQGE